MPILALLLLHIFGAFGLFSAGGASGSGSGSGSGQGDAGQGGDGGGTGGDDGDGDDGDDEEEPEADVSKLKDLVRKLRRESRQKSKELRPLRDYQQQTEAEKRAAAEKKAKDDGNFQQLADEREKEIERLKGELASRDRDALRQKVAAKFKLSPVLAARLVGETEADLERDAMELAKEITPPAAPETEAGRRNQGGDPPKGTTPAAPYRFQQPNDVKW